jgi:hypothetical protein
MAVIPIPGMQLDRQRPAELPGDDCPSASATI